MFCLLTVKLICLRKFLKLEDEVPCIYDETKLEKDQQEEDKLSSFEIADNVSEVSAASENQRTKYD